MLIYNQNRDIGDIMQQKNFEIAHKESEQFYKTIFEYTGTPAVIVEEDSTVSLMNSEIETLYGYKKRILMVKSGQNSLHMKTFQ